MEDFTQNMQYAGARVAGRADFLGKTYLHLLGALALFTGLEVYYFQSGLAAQIAQVLVGAQYGWLMVLGGFMVVSWLATHMTQSMQSLPAQYAGLGIFVVAESLIFVPILWIANEYFPGLIQSAAAVTLMGFTGLTGIVFLTRSDFSFLGTFLWWFGVCALLAIIASVVFGVTLGVWFSVLMIAFAGACILFDTSRVLHHYPEDRYVAAALALFASVALLFWYVLRLMMALRK